MATLTKERCLAMVSEMLEQHRALVMEHAEHLLRSGAIDWQQFEDDYRLPKILLTACLKDKADAFRPFHPDDKKEVENLRRF